MRWGSARGGDGQLLLCARRRRAAASLREAEEGSCLFARGGGGQLPLCARRMRAAASLRSPRTPLCSVHSRQPAPAAGVRHQGGVAVLIGRVDPQPSKSKRLDLGCTQPPAAHRSAAATPVSREREHHPPRRRMPNAGNSSSRGCWWGRRVCVRAGHAPAPCACTTEQRRGSAQSSPHLGCRRTPPPRCCPRVVHPCFLFNICFYLVRGKGILVYPSPCK